MSNPVVLSSICKCSFGAAPCPLAPVAQSTVIMGSLPAATIMDNKIPTFGMCMSPANPAVAAATAAAMGALTSMPCTPVILSPWTPGSPTVLIGGKPLLNSDSVLMCAYGGVIKVAMTPALTITVK